MHLLPGNPFSHAVEAYRDSALFKGHAHLAMPLLQVTALRIKVATQSCIIITAITTNIATIPVADRYRSQCLLAAAFPPPPLSLPALVLTRCRVSGSHSHGGTGHRSHTSPHCTAQPSPAHARHMRRPARMSTGAVSSQLVPCRAASVAHTHPLPVHARAQLCPDPCSCLVRECSHVVVSAVWRSR